MNKITLDKIIINYVYIVTLITIFILNNNQSTYTYIYTKIFNLITTLIMFIMIFIKLIFKNYKINRYDAFLFLLLIELVLITFFYRKYFIFHWIYLLFSYIYFNDKTYIYINGKIKKIMLFIVVISILYQLSKIRFLGVLPVINWYDPNYSGFFIFCLFLLLEKENMRILSKIILLSGFLTLSRNYYLAVLIYIFFTTFKYINDIIIKMRLNKFLVFIFISMFSLIIIENIILKKSSVYYSQNEISKLYTFNDASNHDRFNANKLFKNEITKNFFKYQFGVSIEWYTKNVFRNTPHNFVYALIVNYGIYFTLIFYLLFAKVYDRFFNKENIPIIMSMFLYYLFLGAGIQGYPGILVFYILSDKKEEKFK